MINDLLLWELLAIIAGVIALCWCAAADAHSDADSIADAHLHEWERRR